MHHDPLPEPDIELRGGGPPQTDSEMIREVTAAAKRGAVVVIVILEPAADEPGSDLRILSNAAQNETTRRALHWARRSISLEPT